MAKHHVIPRSRNGPDDEWNLIELSDYDHAYEHAIDFVLFECAPWFDCRQPGWPLLPNDLSEAVRKEQSRRAKIDGRGPRAGKTNIGLKRTPAQSQRLGKAMEGNKNACGPQVKPPTWRANLRKSWTPERREAQRQRMLGNQLNRKTQL